MKKNKIAIVLTGLMLTGMLTGCSLFNSGGIFGPKTVKQEPILPHDRESIAAGTDLKTYTPEEIKKGVVKGDWAIEKVYGKDAVGEEAPFLKFVPDDKRVYGNNGCNTINADYTYNPADSTLHFTNILSTMMLCSKEGITEQEINMALAATTRYTWNMEGSEYYLHFFDDSQQEVMVLMHQNFDFLNGTWKVTAIGKDKVNVEDMKLVIDVEEGKLHGNTGCNIMNGKFEIDMNQANSISFSSIITTRMSCPDMKWETAFIVALEEATAAKPINPTEVVLFNSSHKQVLQLKRTSDN